MGVQTQNTVGIKFQIFKKLTVRNLQRSRPKLQKIQTPQKTTEIQEKAEKISN